MKWQRHILVLAGALAGGVLGHLGFVWLVSQGFYAMILPGGLLGLGAGLARYGNLALAIVCGVLALGFGLVSEWRVFPFVADESFTYFIAHVYLLKPMSLIMIAIGTFFGFWVPYRNTPPLQPQGANRD